MASSFEEVVKNHSDGENIEEGGYLGWLREGSVARTLC